MINLVYPRRCPICETIIVDKNKTICKDCKNIITYIKEPRCKKCSKEILDKEIEYCYDCSLKNHYFDEGIAVFKHDKNLKNSIYNFKYKNKREYADFYVDAILENYKELITSWKADVLVAVP